MLRVVFYKKNIIMVIKLTYLLTGAFLLAKIVGTDLQAKIQTIDRIIRSDFQSILIKCRR